MLALLFGREFSMVENKVSGALKDVGGVVDGAGRAVDAATQAVEQSRKIYGARLLVRGLLWVVLYAIALWLLSDRTAGTAFEIQSRAGRVAMALMPVPFFVWWLWTWMTGAMQMDELQRRIELEALAFAFPSTLVLLATLGLLDSAITPNPAGFSLRQVWLMMPMLYYIGLWRAQRRYA
jgi:hypothetical protein